MTSRSRLALAACLVLTTSVGAQITQNATVFGQGVGAGAGAAAPMLIPAGTDVTAGFSLSSSSLGASANAVFTNEQESTYFRSELRVTGTVVPQQPAAASGEIAVHFSSLIPMQVDVTISITSFVVQQCTSGAAFTTAVGLGVVSDFNCGGMPCSTTFSDVTLDATGLTVELMPGSAGFGLPGCPSGSTVDIGCAVELRPAGCQLHYGPSCGGLSWSATPAVSGPRDYEFEIVDPVGATLGALLLGLQQVSIPLPAPINCTLLNDAALGLSLPLDPSGTTSFAATVPDVPFWLQVVSLDGVVLRMSDGLQFDCP